MVKISAQYLGNLKCEALHEPSGVRLPTDAPKDNLGEGSAFSPTDLVGASLLTCMITTMCIVARRNQIEVGQITGSVEKDMTTTGPRRIATLTVLLRVTGAAAEHRTRLEAAAMGCPVHKSLHPDLQIPVRFEWVD